MFLHIKQNITFFNRLIIEIFLNQKFLFSILLFFVCVSIIFHSFDTVGPNKLFSKIIKSDQKCSPIFQINAISQYKVLIDNILYPQSVPLYMNKSLDFTCLNKSRMHKILFWNKPKRWDFNNIFQSCPISNCKFIFDKTKLNQSELVLFYLYDRDLKKLPKRSNPNQRWILSLYESPPIMVKFIKINWWNSIKLSEIFNLSSTYRINSDFRVKF